MKGQDRAQIDWVVGAEAKERRVLILGAAGGGKSHQVRVEVRVQSKPGTGRDNSQS